MELSRPFAPPSINVPLFTFKILHPSSFSRSITVEMADPHMPTIQQKIAILHDKAVQEWKVYETKSPQPYLHPIAHHSGQYTWLPDQGSRSR